MRKEDDEGIRPLHRPRDWNIEERRIEKSRKKRNWSTRGGYTAPIIIPSTPNSELLLRLRKVADQEAIPGLKFKVLEKGGVTIKHKVQVSNPTATPGCPETDCVACRTERGKGGSCRKGNIQYEMECRLCKEETDRQTDADRTVYIGETSRNLFTRGQEHLYKYETADSESFMAKHQEENHDDRPAVFDAKVTGMYRDCLSRQVAEGVSIRRCRTKVLNSNKQIFEKFML